MPNQIKPDPNQIPSFQEFKAEILHHGAKSNLIDWAANGYGRMPSLLRALTNFDLTGTLGAIDQLLSEKVSDIEQEKVLQAIYALAMRIWEIESKGLNKLPQINSSFYILSIKIPRLMLFHGLM